MIDGTVVDLYLDGRIFTQWIAYGNTIGGHHYYGGMGMFHGRPGQMTV